MRCYFVLGTLVVSTLGRSVGVLVLVGGLIGGARLRLWFLQLFVWFSVRFSLWSFMVRYSFREGLSLTALVLPRTAALFMGG